MRPLEDVAIPPVAEGASPRLRGVLGVPDGAGPFPAVVVIHEAFGVDDQMRGHVARLADLGYLTLLVDLYSEGGPAKCIFATARALRQGKGRPFADIESARRMLAQHPAASDRVGVIGFCMGGGFALLSARDAGFSAASVNYGLLPDDLDAALEGACPVVASYGAKDRSLPGAAAKIEAVLARQGTPRDVKEYPEASHQFLNTAVNGPRFFRPFVRISGFGPDPVAAADAWERIDAFFRDHLGAR